MPPPMWAARKGGVGDGDGALAVDELVEGTDLGAVAGEEGSDGADAATGRRRGRLRCGLGFRRRGSAGRAGRCRLSAARKGGVGDGALAVDELVEGTDLGAVAGEEGSDGADAAAGVEGGSDVGAVADEVV